MKLHFNKYSRKRSNSKLRVLFIPLECSHWRIARGVPYSAYLGFEEGLSASGVEYLTLPAIWRPQSQKTAWLNRAKEICAGKYFDQVWFELVHTHLDEDILEWVTRLAPIRVGFSAESLRYSPKEYALSEMLRVRQQDFENRIKYVTHVVMVDEVDVKDINARRLAHAMWAPAAVPEGYIREGGTKSPENLAIFIGNPYCERATWLESPELKGRLVHIVSSENATRYPSFFDWLNRAAKYYSKSPFLASTANLLYLNLLRRIRRQCFAYYLESLQLGCAVVNLPHFVKTYSYRVVEAMAAGRTAISWEIPDRPQNKALFEDGKEILLYQEDDLGQLADHIQRLIAEPDLAKQIVTNARCKLRRFHTIEKRVKNILDWIAIGDAPTYV